MHRFVIVAAVLAALVVLAGRTPVAHAAVCADYPNQAAAQQAGDTVDADHDGIYCESLPCPCSTAPRHSQAPTSHRPHRKETSAPACTRTRRVVRVTLDRDKYPAILRHIRSAIRRGWPSVLRLHRPGAAQRRERLLAHHLHTRPGYDRDEWPMAFARRSWRADVRLVPSSQNRGSGASIGDQLRDYCDGTRFRVVAG